MTTFSLVPSHCYFHVVSQWACSLGLPGSATGCFEFHPLFHVSCSSAMVMELAVARERVGVFVFPRDLMQL